ncbi:hypothetical protein [Streptomyces sp. NPDC015242]|uniref:hypothetical protein n=1 Tax=Streptomyces sp. NPDC015242 TaxID=3364951 RepID=UPI0036FE4E3B
MAGLAYAEIAEILGGTVACANLPQRQQSSLFDRDCSRIRPRAAAEEISIDI